MALGRTVKDEVLAATQMLRQAGEDDNSYWRRVALQLMEFSDVAKARLSENAQKWLEEAEGVLDKDDEGTIRTPDEFNDELLMKASGFGATSAGVTATPLVNLAVGARVRVVTKDKGELEGVVRQNTTEFLSLDVAGVEENVRVRDVESHFVLDEGPGITHNVGRPRLGADVQRGGDKAAREQERADARAGAVKKKKKGKAVKSKAS